MAFQALCLGTFIASARFMITKATAFADSVLHDLRHGVRVLGRSPGVATAAVLSLGVGIGAATAVFSVFDSLLLRPLPVDDPDGLITLE